MQEGGIMFFLESNMRPLSVQASNKILPVLYFNSKGGRTCARSKVVQVLVRNTM